MTDKPDCPMRVNLSGQSLFSGRLCKYLFIVNFNALGIEQIHESPA